MIFLHQNIFASTGILPFGLSPVPSQVILNVETVALKSSLLTWEIGEATVEELASLDGEARSPWLFINPGDLGFC